MNKKEEAIKILSQMRKDGEGFLSDDTIEAYDMAIEALEQQDKVSDAIKEIKELFEQPAAYVPNYDAYGLCLGIICKHMEVEK